MLVFSVFFLTFKSRNGQVLLTRQADAAKKACGAVLLCAVPVMSFCSLAFSFLAALRA